MPNHVLGEKTGDKKGLPMIRCHCGKEILVVPDVKLMSEAIDAHAEEHKKRIKDPKQAEEEAEHIRDELIAQLFDKASE
ncbi:MAG: hypothetical protein NWE92_07870 [Candidatus Bathyarchaeota archaeon]|nr:hypothetical protein [Candidatus Bathyarchaeota archaeon]